MGGAYQHVGRLVWGVQLRCRDGSLRDVELTSSIIHRRGDTALSCIVAHDVTERKRGEVALREALRKLNILSGITRHDILNQLTVLYGYLELSSPAVAGTSLGECHERSFVLKREIICFFCTVWLLRCRSRWRRLY
jgi:PAS domain-containing protein